MLSQTRFSLPYSLAALRFRYDLWKNQIYPSNPYHFANTIGAVPRVSSEPISSRDPIDSVLCCRPLRSTPQPPALLSLPHSPLLLLCSRLDALFRPQSSAYPRPTPSLGKH